MQLTARDARRRWFGALFLILSLVMLIWGVTFLGDRLVRHPLAFLFYWVGCALFTLLALLNALLDMFIMRKRSRDEQISVARESLGDIEERLRQQEREESGN